MRILVSVLAVGLATPCGAAPRPVIMAPVLRNTSPCEASPAGLSRVADRLAGPSCCTEQSGCAGPLPPATGPSPEEGGKA